MNDLNERVEAHIVWLEGEITTPEPYQRIAASWRARWLRHKPGEPHMDMTGGFGQSYCDTCGNDENWGEYTPDDSPCEELKLLLKELGVAL